MGYRLNNGAIGVLFNDLTSITFSYPFHTYQNVVYISAEKNAAKISFTTLNAPSSLKKKLVLLSNFKTYIDKSIE